jgi:hypothetical protein
MSSIIESIEKLRYYTDSNLKIAQQQRIPTFLNIKMEVRYSYILNEQEYSVVDDDKICYLVDNLPIIGELAQTGYIESMQNMVNNMVIQPFLLFLNNEFIKWSDMDIIIGDSKYCYILVKNNLMVDPDYKMILLPNCEYIENASTTTADTWFIFKDGKCLDTITTDCTVINIFNPNLYYESKLLTNGSRQSCNINSKYKISTNNLLFFKNGYLYSDPTVEHHGLNVFSVDNNTFGVDDYLCKIFYFMYANESKDNILNIRNESYIYNQVLNSGSIPNYLKTLAQPFDFQFDKNKTYEENVADALDYIMTYNSGLMDDVYDKASNVVTKTYTGAYINSIKNINGYITMSRRIKGNLNNYVIIFVNGLLYRYHSEVVYKNKDFTFPVININDTDSLELVFFTNIDNRVYDVIFGWDKDDYILDPSIDVGNMKLFTMDVEKRDFYMERLESVQYEVEFDTERIEADKVKLTPKSSFYYDKRLSLVSARQFRYMSYVAKEETINFRLDPSFNFCNDESKYLVFVNSRKLDRKNYKLTIIQPSRPFDNISLYLNIALEIDDRVEIIYVPDTLEETTVEPNIPLSGNVYLDRTKISYNFSKELYFVFINGKKINKNDMIDIDSNKLRINTNTQSINNLCIIKHIQDDEVLKSMFDNTTDIFTTTLNSISDSERNTLYSPDDSITNTEANMITTTIDMKEVIYEIVRDYWLRPGINTGDVFLYDYEDTSLFTETDDDGNMLVDAENANNH